MKIHFFAVGRLKPGPLLTLCEEYRKRLTWRVQIHESPFSSSLSGEPLRKAISQDLREKSATVGGLKVILDERGQQWTSKEFADKLDAWQTEGQTPVSFLIGGAEGLIPDLIDPQAPCLSLGKATWPHMMVRVMVLEQLYRAQQILAGHPYHK